MTLFWYVVAFAVWATPVVTLLSGLKTGSIFLGGRYYDRERHPRLFRNIVHFHYVFILLATAFIAAVTIRGAVR